MNLQGHAVHDELHGKMATILWNAVAEDWVGGVGATVGLNKSPHEVVEHGGPDGTDLVDFTEAVDGGVHVGVGLEVSGVQVCSDTLGVVSSPGTHGVVGVFGVTGL